MRAAHFFDAEDNQIELRAVEPDWQPDPAELLERLEAHFSLDQSLLPALITPIPPWLYSEASEA